MKAEGKIEPQWASSKILGAAFYYTGMLAGVFSPRVWFSTGKRHQFIDEPCVPA